MVTRITAKFETPEAAEAALKRVRENVRGVYSTNFFYDRMSDRAERLRGGTIYTVMPTAVTSSNYMTGVLESPAAEAVIPEPRRSRSTNVFIVCDGSGNDTICSILSNMGGMDIYSPYPSA